MIAPDPRLLVVDANPIIYQLNQHTLASRFTPFLLDATLLISFQTVAELRLMALRRNWGNQRRREMEGMLERMYVVSPTEEVLNAWVDLCHRQERAGSRIGVADAWVAATALVYGCPVLTNDRGDFARIEGLEVLPPA
ncbi:MAG: PIN domain-containing protein [Dehalococcoidia bacterium]|nr:PIN domain-containing protein [Dehalococcoidia bacterium]